MLVILFCTLHACEPKQSSARASKGSPALHFYATRTAEGMQQSVRVHKR